MNIVKALGIHSRVYTPLMQRLLQSDASLEQFHNGLISSSSAKAIAKKRTTSFSDINRKVLVESIKNQYKGFSLTEEVLSNINRLAQPNAVTVTTGHQLNIFTGPLFFWYKILDAINTAEKLQKSDGSQR